MKHIIKTRLPMLVGAFAIAFGAHVVEITVMNFGGTNGDAQKATFNKPFEAQTGNKVTVVEYNDEWAKIKTVVEAKYVGQDVVEVESGGIGRGYNEGLSGKLDQGKIAEKTNLIPGVSQTCGVGSLVWSAVLVYNINKLKTILKGWADFWDMKTFPGKRGIRKGARYNLEFVLTADGVPVKNVYKVLATKGDQNRALKKFDQLKPNVQWWEVSAQPPQFLAAGDTVTSAAFSGRIDAAQRESKNLRVVWNDSIYGLDYWATPKGSPNKALAEQYIAYTLSQKPQQKYARHIAYGLVNVVAVKAFGAKTQASMPNLPENNKNTVLQNLQFWADRGDKPEQRFAS